MLLSRKQPLTAHCRRLPACLTLGQELSKAAAGHALEPASGRYWEASALATGNASIADLSALIISVCAARVRPSRGHGFSNSLP